MSNHRLYQLVADRLMQRLDNNRYALGDRLPGERELAEEFEVSRVTVREALIALQANGRIEIKAGSGAYVTRPTVAAEGLPQSVSPLELTEARLLFESEAAALAARNISSETLDHLSTLADVVSNTHPDDARIALIADQDFHLTIASASNNVAVEHTIRALWRMRMELTHIRDAHASVCSDASALERGDEHKAILVALQSRDPDAARSAMQAHFKRLLKSLIDASEAQAVNEQRSKAAASRARFLDTHTQGIEA